MAVVFNPTVVRLVACMPLDVHTLRHNLGVAQDEDSAHPSLSRGPTLFRFVSKFERNQCGDQRRVVPPVPYRSYVGDSTKKYPTAKSFKRDAWTAAVELK